jgi:hypothetical protein
MIVKKLDIDSLKKLKETGSVFLQNYRIAWRPGKQFMVTRYGDTVNGKRARETVTIFDIFSFFHSSMIKAATGILGADAIPELVTSGKANRGQFKYEELDTEILPYWKAEGEVMRQMMLKFRDLPWGARQLLTEDTRCTESHGVFSERCH